MVAVALPHPLLVVWPQIRLCDASGVTPSVQGFGFEQTAVLAPINVDAALLLIIRATPTAAKIVAIATRLAVLKRDFCSSLLLNRDFVL